MQELKPCPACGKKSTIYEVLTPHEFSVHCCFCSFPDLTSTDINPMPCIGFNGHKASLEEAIDAWNSLPRALTWTTESPKIDGFYWWDCEQENIGTPTMVHVSVYDGYLHFMTLTFGDGSPFFHECDKCRWAGPISEPQEPKP